MKVFIDTNVVLENLCDRKLAADAQMLFQHIDNGDVEGCINSGSFSNITYIAESQLKKNGLDKKERISLLRLILSEILDRLAIVPQTGDDLQEGVDDTRFADLEDSYQYQAFKKSQCDYLITINTHDFPCSTDPRIMHLTDFVRDVLAS